VPRDNGPAGLLSLQRHQLFPTEPPVFPLPPPAPILQGQVGRPTTTHALDNLRHFACSLAVGTREFVHSRRIHSHPSRDRDRRPHHSRYPGTEPGLTSQLLEHNIHGEDTQ